MAVKIIIDSASDISEEEARELGIKMLPMKITINGREYLDGIELNARDFYEMLEKSSEFPKTSQVTPFEFERAFERVVSEGDEAVVITISSKLSGTYQSAKIAQENFEGKIFVVDSLSATVGERLLCELALSLIKEGKSASEIADTLDKIKTRIHLMARLETLEYLKKGGRISALTAFAGELLAIKPVIAIIDGEVKLIGKARGTKNGNGLLTNLVNKVGIDFTLPIGTIYSGTSREALEQYIEQSAEMWETETASVPMHTLGATIGVHIGGGAIGVAFFEAE